MVYKEKFNELMELVEDEQKDLPTIRWEALDIKREALKAEERQENAEQDYNQQTGSGKQESKIDFFRAGRKI